MEPNKKHDTKIAISFIKKKEIERLKEEFEAIPSKTFDNYLIAYIDFLGMKDRMETGDGFKTLFWLKEILKSVKGKATFIKSTNEIDDFIIKVFSDNIVIVQKMENDILNDQIISIINLVALLQFEALFAFGLSLRGGITLGELSIDDSVVWGTGLIEAYQIENSIANYPRVVISQKMIDAYEKCKNTKIDLFTLIKQDNDGCWFVDYIKIMPSVRLIPKMAAHLGDVTRMSRKKNDRIKQKTNWTISYFNSYCTQNYDDYEKYILPYII